MTKAMNGVLAGCSRRVFSQGVPGRRPGMEFVYRAKMSMVDRRAATELALIAENK